MAIKLKVRQPESVKLNVNGDSTVSLKLGEAIIGVMPNPYSGSYTVTPSEAEQTLPTEGMSMEHDVTVEAAVLQNVNKSYSPSASEQTDTITADPDHYGIGEVSVTIAPAELQEKARTIGMNGTYTDTPDEGYYGLSKVTTTVPQATVNANAEAGYTTIDGNYKWRFRPIANVNPAGWAVNGNRFGSYATYDAIPSGTTVTPSTGAQTIGGANTMMEGAVTVNAMPNATWRGGSRIEPTISMAVDSTTGEVSASVNTSTAIMPLNGSGYADRMTTYGVTVANSNTLQLDTQNGSTITPTTSEQTAVPAGTYTLGDVKVSAMPNGYRGASTISATWNSTKRFYTITYGSATNGYYPATQWNSIPPIEMTRVWETVTPTESTQEITPQNSYHFIDKVTVDPIPPQYIIPTGAKSITANGTGIDVTSYASVDVAVPGSSPNLQNKNKSYTPSETAQSETVSADAGYDGLGTVDVSVDAISSTYVGSGITRRDSTDLSASGATVSVPSGFYENNASKAVASGSVTAPTTISGSQATLSTGTNTITLQKTLSVTPNVTTAGYISSGTAGNALVSLNANVTTQAAQTLYPSSSDQTIQSGRYLTGNQTIKAVAVSSNLTADNIKNGVTVTVGDSADADRILSVTGTYTGGGGGSVQFDTKTTTASNYPVSLSFSSMKGEPKAFVVRLNAQVSSSGNTTYYYIVDISHFGTTTHGNCFRIGSTRRVDNITSGYSFTYSNSTLTITSSASSRSASPGAFYSGSYELLYCY